MDDDAMEVVNCVVFEPVANQLIGCSPAEFIQVALYAYIF